MDFQSIRRLVDVCFVGFDPAPPGVDMYPFPDIGSLGSNLDILVTQDDQL
jgi:hypothetical protein